MGSPEMLEKILERCKCTVYLTVNEHRSYYEKVEQFIADRCNKREIDEIGKDVLNEMINTDTIVELQFYPDTPIGFYRLLHHDLEAILSQANQVLNEREESDNGKS